MTQTQYLQIVTEMNKLQAQMSNLWMTIQSAAPEFSPTNNITNEVSNKIVSNNSNELPGSWFERIRYALELRNQPSSAREIAEVLAPLMNMEVKDIISRVNTFCSTMRDKDMLELIPSYPGSKRGKYKLPEQTIERKASPTRSDAETLDAFKEWLPQNGVAAAVITYASRLSMFENATGERAEDIIKRIGIDKTLKSIDETMFEKRSTQNDVRTAIKKFGEFLKNRS